MRDPETGAFFDEEPVNRADLACGISQKGRHKPNARHIWTPNVGVWGIDSVADVSCHRIAKKEFETVLSELFKKRVKISIAD